MNNIKLINASAGSGKTYRLTSDIVKELNEGLLPESVMATTFTIKAAAELKERIRFQLLKNKKYEEAFRINDGFIGTVNSTCSRLLKEYAIEAGISPAVDVISEEDSGRIFKISIDSVLNQYADKMEHSARRLCLDGGGTGYRKNPDWRDYVRAIVDFARSNQIMPDVLKECSKNSFKSLKSVFGEPIKHDLDNELKDEIRNAINYLENLNSSVKKTQNALEELKNCYKCFNRNKQTWKDWTCLAKLESGKDGKDAIIRVNAIADNVLNHPLFQEDVKQIIEGCFECAIYALKNYEQYKKTYGLMDFVDQETMLLNMAIHNNAFRTSMRDRIKILMVDEFQDTSPIQLALFLALNELAEKSVWVGDPKQAIYGFRGTDPQLMNEIVALLKNSEILKFSWRSKERLLNFTNTVFSEVFYEMGKEKVWLEIPEERAEKAKGGWLELWHLTVKNNKDEAAAVANGVSELLKRIPRIKPGDVAVLCRKNTYCADIAAALENLGIRVSAGQGSLMKTRECRLAIAALRFMNDQEDTLALAEIIHLTSKYKSNEDWIARLAADPEDTKKKWMADILIAPLNECRENIKHWSVLEALEQAISKINLTELIKSWKNPGLARCNLDALRGICREYINQCSAHRCSVTIKGFINYLTDTEANQAQGSDYNTVKVITYHKAKGLEWPWVILTGLDAALNDDVFGVHIEAAEHFNPTQPLNERKIRFWPWPFGSHRSYARLEDKINTLPVKKQIREKAIKEEQRLLYVGMTRAKDGLVLSIRKTVNNSGVSLKTAWLDILKNADNDSVINLSTDVNNQTIYAGNTQIPATVFEYGPKEDEITNFYSEDEYIAALSGDTKQYPAARISPSSITEHEMSISNIDCKVIKSFNKRISINSNADMNLIGNAVHSYLAFDYEKYDHNNQIKIINKILKNWNADMFINAEDLRTAGENLIRFINENYKDCKIFKEWPISMINKSGQLIQGWIDMLIETPKGYVIVDHKDYPGKGAQEYAKKYAPQLKAYKEAVEKAAGKPVIDMLIHMPVGGMIMRMELS